MRPHYTADPRLVLVLVLTVFGAFAWLTRHPDSEALRQAESWPGVGPLASRFKAAYASPTRATQVIRGGDDTRGEVGNERIVTEWVVPDRVSARPQVWLEPGTQVQVSPHAASEVLATVEALGNYSVVGRRGDWFHIYSYSLDRGILEGWVYLEAYEEPSAERLLRAEPVLPMAAVPPDTLKVERARSFMLEGGVERRCGPYILYTDVEAERMPERCGQLASRLEEVYRERFGLNPIGEPAEAIFLFRAQDVYRGFISEDEAEPAERAGHASPSRGYVALYSEDLPREAVTSTLIHELTHLINRRALGPALPPWLDEGLADDLAESRLDESGRPVPGGLSGYGQASGTAMQHFGGTVSPGNLIAALDGTGLPDLRHLVQMGSDEFHEAPYEALRYALSASWVRFLLSDAPGSDPAGFRAYLAAVASGEIITPDLLVQHVGGDWSELEAGFQTWVRFQTAPLPRTLTVDR